MKTLFAILAVLLISVTAIQSQEVGTANHFTNYQLVETDVSLSQTLDIDAIINTGTAVLNVGYLNNWQFAKASFNNEIACTIDDDLPLIRTGHLPDRQIINTVLFDKTKYTIITHDKQNCLQDKTDTKDNNHATNQVDKPHFLTGKNHKSLIAVKWKHLERTSNRYNIMNPGV